MKTRFWVNLMIIVLSAHIPTALGNRSGQGQHPDTVPKHSIQFSDLPRDALFEVADYLDPTDRNELSGANQQARGGIFYYREIAEQKRIRAEQARLQGTEIVPLSRFDAVASAKVSREFAKLGPMYQVAGLIWSGVAPREMEQRNAVTYCRRLRGGARLPTREEYIALSRAMGSRQPSYSDDIGVERVDYDVDGYHRDLIPDMHGKYFWAAPVHPRNIFLSFLFNGGSGGVFKLYAEYPLGSVRCVREVETQRFGGTVLGSLDVRDVADIVRVDESHPRYHEVTPAFRAMGDMHEVGALIWSGVASSRMTQRDAVAFCDSLGGSARLPSIHEYSILSEAMGSTQPIFYVPDIDVSGYNSDLIPGMSGQWFGSGFWADPWTLLDGHLVMNAVYFRGATGSMQLTKTFWDWKLMVRCVS